MTVYKGPIQTEQIVLITYVLVVLHGWVKHTEVFHRQPDLLRLILLMLRELLEIPSFHKLGLGQGVMKEYAYRIQQEVGSGAIMITFNSYYVLIPSINFVHVLAVLRFYKIIVSCNHE